MEKIKRDNNRVDISKLEPDETSGDDLTGGYIVKVDKWDGETNDGWYSEPLLDDFDGVWYQYHYPKPDDIIEEQRDYIMDYITDFETLMSSDIYNDPEEGYYEKVNLESFIDVSLLSEISKNVDAYRLSAYMYKDKDSLDGRLTMGPIWDYNLAFGNADYYDGWNPEGWQIDVELGNDGFKIPFWWYQIWADETFQDAFNQRWQELRQTIFSDHYIMDMIDSTITVINDAQDRNFHRWPVLDEYVWPNAYVGGSYVSEINYLKDWITQRLEWMDSELLLLDIKEDHIPSYFWIKKPYPNPFNPKTAFVVNVTNNSSFRLDIYNILGKKVKSINKNVFPEGKHTITWNATNDAGSQIESGVYLYEILINNRLETGKLLYIK